MSDLQFRFLHAADFRLDRPMQGLTDVPSHMRELLIDAPYQAAERVFDAAVTLKVPLVCLAGNILGLETPSARAFAFLQQQFERLAEHEITVFWAGGHADSTGAWRDVVAFPETVH